MDAAQKDPKAEAFWQAFAAGNADVRKFRRLVRALPSSPRCKMCYVPFRSMGWIFRLRGIAPSAMNPNYCNKCEMAPLGGAEVEVGILFADVRGFTAMSESQAPDEVASRLNRFYKVATGALIGHDAMVDKLVGDQAMGLFLPGMTEGPAPPSMLSAARQILAGVGYGGGKDPWLEVGIGLDFGRAFVGMVGSAEVKDFTALGDVVNTAARLQAAAGPGQIVLSDSVFEGTGGEIPDAAHVSPDLKGKEKPVSAWITGAV